MQRADPRTRGYSSRKKREPLCASSQEHDPSSARLTSHDAPFALPHGTTSTPARSRLPAHTPPCRPPRAVCDGKGNRQRGKADIALTWLLIAIRSGFTCASCVVCCTSPKFQTASNRWMWAETGQPQDAQTCQGVIQYNERVSISKRTIHGELSSYTKYIMSIIKHQSDSKK